MNTPTLHQKKMLHKIAPLVGVAILITMIWLIFSHHETAAAEHKNAQPDAPMFTHQGNEIIVPADSPLKSHLVVAAISDASTANVLSLPAVVEADPSSTVNILPPLTGRLVSLSVKLGDVVTKGQVLATINSPDLAQAVSDTRKAQDALDLANKALIRARGVNGVGANATKDLEAAESAHTQTQAEFDRAQSRLNTLTMNETLIGSEKSRKKPSATLTITAPTSGTITTLNIGAGAYINDMTASLMTISNLDHVWVSANIPEELIANIHQGVTVDVTLPAYPDITLHGKINSISPVLDADTRRSKARIEFDNTDQKLKPNMFATAHISVAAKKQLNVPQSALLMNNDNTTVFVEVRPNVFVRRVVELGTENETSVNITAGLNANDRIVVQGGVLLND
ncbi:MAG: efflux RND transporter periplasmic adaptor subunit [Gammaproteobacteria bacterium]|nr:efflux RND transporter periplasmic adaptor subunit [Gammaproteobacteria bacterium]